jgi:hypothetical protein
MKFDFDRRALLEYIDRTKEMLLLPENNNQFKCHWCDNTYEVSDMTFCKMCLCNNHPFPIMEERYDDQSIISLFINNIYRFVIIDNNQGHFQDTDIILVIPNMLTTSYEDLLNKIQILKLFN